MVETAYKLYNVGGVMLERPFKVRRFGHIGLNVNNLEACMHFYRQLLGFRISDAVDHSKRVPPGTLDGVGDPHYYFMRYAGDHHSFVIGDKKVRETVRPGSTTRFPKIDIGQLSWQVDTLAETVNVLQWLEAEGIKLNRTGRDMPGSNWHTYFNDPDGHNNELFYGMEQIGWDGITKPLPMYRDRFGQPPTLPQRSESEEIEDSIRDGIDITDGNRDPEEGPFVHDVDGVLLSRPFRITRIGPVGLFVEDMDVSLAFYRDKMGFKVTERQEVLGETVYYLRANTEHHSMALHPWALKEKLNSTAQSTLAYIGFQLGSFKQLRAAKEFLIAEGATLLETPLEFQMGHDYAAHFLDPEGHCVRLYHAIDHVNWEGQPRPQRQRNVTPVSAWPEALTDSDTAYSVEIHQGPLG